MIESTDPGKRLVFVVFINATSELSHIAEIADPSARSRVIEQKIWEAKKRLLDIVSRYQDAGMEIVNDFEGAPSLVLAGPASVWKDAVSENQSIATDPKLELVPNKPTWRIAQ